MSTITKFEELVYSGMVIDDHGNWITITEKLQKEKLFLSHLERGEILINGKWITISDHLKTAPLPSGNDVQSTYGTTAQEETTLDSQAHAEETSYFTKETIFDLPKIPQDSPSASTPDIMAQTPEETVSFSTDTLQDFRSEALMSETNSDIVYPPETRSLYIEPAKTLDAPEKNSNTPATTNGTPATEFEETVLYNINVLKNSSTAPKASEPSALQQNSSGQPKSPYADLQVFAEEHQLQKSRIPGSVLVIIAISIVILIVMIRLFL